MERTGEIILNLKQIRKESEITLPRLMEMIERNGDYVSMSTLRRVFAEGSEVVHFRYEDTIQPIARVLLHIDDDDTEDISDAETVQALKHIISVKNDLIDDLKAQIEEMKSTYQKRADFLMHQIELKDARMDEKDRLFREMWAELKGRANE